MKTTDIIRQNISKIPVGKIFTYNDFPVAAAHKEALYKGLNRMASSGQIAKLTNGRFYKPRDTVFGKLKPSLDEQIKDLLEKNGKPIGYISGLGALNYLGLTTQVLKPQGNLSREIALKFHLFGKKIVLKNRT